MATAMRNYARLTYKEALECRVLVSCLESLPSQLQQRLFRTSLAVLTEFPHGTSYNPRSRTEQCVRFNLSHGNHGPFMKILSFGPRTFPSGSLYFSPHASVPSRNSIGKITIYTAAENKGESSVYDRQTRRVGDATFEAFGDVEELNSALGLAHEYCSQAKLSSTLQQIEEIQSRLLDIGSAVATPLNNLSAKKLARVKFNTATVDVLEAWVDKMAEELPNLTGFILPSGGLPAASLHVARAICQRAERKVVTLVEEQVVDQSVVLYLNRLNTYLFTAARYAALKLGKPETEWRINRR